MGFGIFLKWKNLDGHSFCESCAVTWFEQRRHRVLQELCRGAPPIEAFRIPRVRTRNPDRPKSQEILLGLASFTNKGVCFVQLARQKGADPGWGLAFGVIGAAIAGSAAKRREKESFEQIEQGILRNADDFPDLLQRAEQVLYYPREDISRLKFDSAGFAIRTRKLRKRFLYEGGRKAFKQFRDVAKAYSRALESGTDPLQACRSETLLGPST